MDIKGDIMIIICEGVNRVGKTTVGKMFEQTFGFKYFKDNLINELLDINKQQYTMGSIYGQLNLLLKLKSVNIFVDRFHLTEFVYGVLDRNYKVPYFSDVDEKLAKAGAKLLYMTDDINAINQRAGRDLTQHKVLFDTLFKQSKMDKLEYNLRDDFNKVAQWLDIKLVKYPMIGCLI